MRECGCFEVCDEHRRFTMYCQPVLLFRVSFPPSPLTPTLSTLSFSPLLVAFPMYQSFYSVFRSLLPRSPPPLHPRSSSPSLPSRCISPSVPCSPPAPTCWRKCKVTMPCESKAAESMMPGMQNTCKCHLRPCPAACPGPGPLVRN